MPWSAVDNLTGPQGPPGYPARITTQAALAEALTSGGEIHVDGSVTIALTATLQITQPTRLVGGRLVAPAGAPALRVTSSDVEIAGTRIDGQGITGAYASGQKLIHVLGTSSAPLTGVNIHDCRLTGSRGDCIWLEWCVGANVANNIIRDFLYGGVMVISGRGVKVVGNDISNAPLSAGVVNVYGIAFTDTANTEAARSRDCSAVGNRVHLIDWEGIDTHGGDGITIVGNTVTACPRGIALVSGNETRIAVPTRCTVSGNTVDATGLRQPLREGIFLGGLANNPASGTITGNHITGYGAATFAVPYIDRAKTYVGSNSEPLVPWTDLDLSGGFAASTHVDYRPQYKIDGNTVWLRGGVIYNGTFAKIGRIPNANAWPLHDEFIGPIRGSNSNGTNPATAVVSIDTDGTIYPNLAAGSWSNVTMWLHGSYQAV